MIYDNCIIQAPDGINLSRCSKKKARWYLERDLAEEVAKNPLTIRLKFEPSGRCGLNDPHLISGKPNVCVVCGITKNLTRHHIVPYSFIKYMRNEYKMDVIKDILPLCESCHNKYEMHSKNKREELATRYHSTRIDASQKLRKLVSYAKAILLYSEKMPPDRVEELYFALEDFFGKQPKLDDLERLASSNIHYANSSEEVARCVENDYNNFSREWRQHFVDIMHPKYMPKSWTIDRITNVEDVWVPHRVRIQNAKSRNSSNQL